MAIVRKLDAEIGERTRQRARERNTVQLAPKSFAARNALSRILLEMGDIKGATRQLEEAVRLAPDSPECHFALSRAYARAGRKQDADRERAEFARLKKLQREVLYPQSNATSEPQSDDRPPI